MLLIILKEHAFSGKLVLKQHCYHEFAPNVNNLTFDKILKQISPLRYKF